MPIAIVPSPDLLPAHFCLRYCLVPSASGTASRMWHCLLATEFVCSLRYWLGLLLPVPAASFCLLWYCLLPLVLPSSNRSSFLPEVLPSAWGIACCLRYCLRYCQLPSIPVLLSSLLHFPPSTALTQPEFNYNLKVSAVFVFPTLFYPCPGLFIIFQPLICHAFSFSLPSPSIRCANPLSKSI